MNFKTIKSYAKINVGLKILDILPDGYHAVSTIMQEIDFYDFITIKPIEKLEIQITCIGPVSVPEDDSNDDEHHSHDINRHGKTISSFTISYERSLDWTAFGIWLTMLLNSHGENVLRVKGILNVKGVDAPVIINGVQHVVHPPIHLNSWPTNDRRSHIALITPSGILLRRSHVPSSSI